MVGGNVVVEVAPGANTYTVSYGGAGPDTYPTVGSGTSTGPTLPVTPASGPKKYAWSSRSQVYHYADCDFVANISKENLQQGDTPPRGKHLHTNCPVGGH